MTRVLFLNMLRLIPAVILWEEEKIVIKKERRSTHLLEAFYAADRRLSNLHPASTQVKLKIAKLKAGLGGEQQLDQIIRDYKFPLTYNVFNDLSLTSSMHFQIDTLFITPSYAIVFEVKNIAGALKVIENPPQMIRTLDTGQVNGFNSPINQVQNSCELLQDWLHSRGISLPIYGVVVLAYAKNPVNLFETPIPFLYPSAVPRYIRSLQTDPQLLDDATFEMLSNDLLKGHQEFIPSSICTHYLIEKHDIKTGVHCISCGFFGMDKYAGGWRCRNCKETSNDAHEQAIMDWFHLFGGEMSNNDCRAFLHIDRQQTAYRLMKKMNMDTSGTFRNRTYTLNLSERLSKRT